ncbi:Inner membrane protein YgaZ [Campylobacter suis]|uniref:Inner membrane protein YgaZ n=2 Tax=Campylobacter suis TaxID=2790657 RepID=A0ABN7K1C9_9BACT|nr:AzlC family ABC transporter permease [Campylobacter suis]CAD7286299.1 Inner membrane protein YgaZ [Campylobacter suis]
MSNLEIFKLSIPIFMGYFPLGMAFGILAIGVGVSAFIAISLSFLTYAGAAQFMMVGLFASGTGLVEAFVVSYLVNLRHTFYGLALLKEYENLRFRLFNVATLTDETFAVFKMLKIEDVSERSRVFTALNFLCWFYWLTGTALGCFAGALISADMSGLEFSLTALFIAIVIEMFKSDRNFIVLGAAVLFGVIGVTLMPAKFMLVGSMGLCFVFLSLFKDKL